MKRKNKTTKYEPIRKQRKIKVTDHSGHAAGDGSWTSQATRGRARLAVAELRYTQQPAGTEYIEAHQPTNRRIVDIISDVNMAYSEHARRYLADTGLPKERTYVTGSPMAEVRLAA